MLYETKTSFPWRVKWLATHSEEIKSNEELPWRI